MNQDEEVLNFKIWRASCPEKAFVARRRRQQPKVLQVRLIVHLKSKLAITSGSHLRLSVVKAPREMNVTDRVYRGKKLFCCLRNKLKTDYRTCYWMFLSKITIQKI